MRCEKKEKKVEERERECKLRRRDEEEYCNIESLQPLSDKNIHARK